MVRARPHFERTSYGLLVVRLFDIPVNYDLTWRNALRAGFPQTTDDQRIVRCENLYPNERTGTEMIPCISLVCFGRNWRSQEALDLSTQTGLPPIDPRMAFAVGKAYPTLNTDIGWWFLSVVSLQTCVFEDEIRVPSPWYNSDSSRPDQNEAWREGQLCKFDGEWKDRNLPGLVGDILS